MLELVRLTGVTQIHHLKRKNLIGYVEYWNAGCGESRTSGVDAGKERKLLPMHTSLLLQHARLSGYGSHFFATSVCLRDDLSPTGPKETPL